MKKIVCLIFIILIGFSPLAKAQLFGFNKTSDNIKINKSKPVTSVKKTSDKPKARLTSKPASKSSSAKSSKSYTSKDDIIADFIESDENSLNVSYEQVQKINQQAYKEMENVLAIVPPEKRSDLVEALAHIERQAQKQDEFIKKYEEESAQETQDSEKDKENSQSDDKVTEQNSYPTLEAIEKNKINTKNYYDLKRLLNNNVTAKYKY